jgi:hypothetical protein
MIKTVALLGPIKSGLGPSGQYNVRLTLPGLVRKIDPAPIRNDPRAAMPIANSDQVDGSGTRRGVARDINCPLVSPLIRALFTVAPEVV